MVRTQVATCKHFGTCGGCSFQDIPYPEQVRQKEIALRNVLRRDVSVLPSPREYNYRTRMDYIYTSGMLGQRRKDVARTVLDLEECHLLSPRASDALQHVKNRLREMDISFYHWYQHRGYLRYVTFREAPVTGELMIVFLTNGDDPAIVPLLEEAKADSVVWCVSNRRADVTFGEMKEYPRRPWIEETLGDVRYRFGPGSFFQSNPWVTEEIYRHVAERIAGRTADVYCGVGGISLFAASRADEMIGLDNNREAIAFADHNKKANGISNASFYVGDARLFLCDLRCDTLLLDPPRSGMGPSNVRKCVRAMPERIVYVSCNPKMLAEELPHFEGYDLEEVQGFDLFPQTPHVEVVATLRRAT